MKQCVIVWVVMGKYSKKSLEWWIEDPDFDPENWWMISGADQLDFDNKHLLAGERTNDSKVYRPGPIFWELLRRHPELPKLREAARGRAAANLRGENLYQRLACLDEKSRGCAFYLIALYQKSWIDLPGDVPRRFEHLLPGLYETVGVEGKVRMRFPNSAIDLLHESYDQLGHAGAISSFFVQVDPIVLNEDFKPEHAIESGHEMKATERVLMLDRLESELSRLDLELGLFALHKSCGNASVIDALRRLLERFRSGPAKGRTKEGRLQPEVLRHLSVASGNGGYTADGSRKVSEYFEELSFAEMIASLHRFDREQADLLGPDS